jgi:hypothetical protein
MFVHNLMIFTIVGPKLLWNLGHQSILLLYLGPETLMPLASIVGAIIGLLLIFWRVILRFFKKIFRFVSRQHSDPSASDPSFAELHSDTQKRI